MGHAGGWGNEMSSSNNLNQLFFKCLTITDSTESMAMGIHPCGFLQELRRALQMSSPETGAALTAQKKNSALNVKLLVEK